MAVVVKNNQPEESELICGVSNDCVVLQPVKLEPEPVNFISVNNGMYEATTSISELYNCRSSTSTYQQLSSFSSYPPESQVTDLITGEEFPQQEFSHTEFTRDDLPQQEYAQQEYPQPQEEVLYEGADEFPQPEATSEHSSSTLSVPVQDYYEIQVAEEEVVSDNWNVDHTEVVVEDAKPPVEDTKEPDDVEIPLPTDQDIYSQMHPYPCDFCSRRFSKKSTLMSHMVSHQTERPHGCNLCGARYRRKCDLVNHMKIHAYPPPRTTLEEDDDDMQGSVGGEVNKGRRKKAQSLAPKKNSFSSDLSDTMEYKEERPFKISKNRLMKKSSKSLPPKSVSYVDEDMRLLSEMSRNTDIANQVPRWPIVDQSRPYVCQHCGVGFAREKALASHSRIHGGDSPFECDVCGEMFWDVSLLREHSRAKHPHVDPGSTSGIGAESVYTGDDRFGNFFCETCGVSFHRLDLLKKHRRSHHVKVEPQDVGDDDQVCTVCGQFFDDVTELRVHAETHRLENHRCNACGAQYPSASELSEHVRSAHQENNAQDSTCTLCGKVCKDRRALAKHACSLADNRSFPCYSCNKRFHSRARLRRHMVSHRDKAVSCSDCGEEFPDGRALMSHRHSHNSTNNHPARSFPCHDCGKTFGSRSSQQIHVRIHTGERPYGCRFCWKAFADGGTLRKHERIHTGEKPYVCPVCPKAFNQRVVLREHIRAHHSGSDSKVNSCYECKVCGYLFSSSSELCVHLVQHSDENTAKHRMPSMGPRKYKRRRKVGPPSPIKVSSPGIDFESTDSSDSMIEKKEKKIIKKKYNYDSPPQSQDLENAVVESFESAIQNISSMVEKSEPKKQKLDKLLKKHKTKALSKLTKLTRIEKRAKAAKLLNSTSYASKYVVSRPDDMRPLDGQIRPRTKNVTYPILEDSLETILNGSDPPRANRPRTKNVNYHNMKVTKLQPAMFPTTKTKVKKTRMKKSMAKKEKVKPSTSDIFNGSDLNINELDLGGNTVVGEEKLETCIVDDFNIEGVHNEVRADDLIPSKMEFNQVMIKSETLTCEMCGDGFADRSELLGHIRIHI